MTGTTTTDPRARAAGWALGGLLCLYAVVLLRTAWLSDDAYITFRTIDNWIHGYGLRWNVAERVQTCTHPLWMFLHAGLYALSGEIYYTSILLCIGVSLAAVILFAARLAAGALPALVGVTVFTLSKAFTDYSTSGLENPLTHLLLVLFLYVYLREPAAGAATAQRPQQAGPRGGLSAGALPGWRTLLALALLAALLALNRPDALLPVLPALCARFWRARSWRAVGTVLLGLVPLIAWELFALLYYGSPLPNTAYAKLNNGIPAGELLGQGLWYLWASLRWDPLTPAAIVAGLAVGLSRRQARHVSLAVGVLLYMAYLLFIGGDFMLGRFLTAPLVVAVALLARVPLSRRTGLLLFLLAGIIGAAPPRSPLSAGRDYGDVVGVLIDGHGICDERGYYYHATGLLLAPGRDPWPDHSYVRQGRAARQRGEPVVVARCVGMFGYCAGPAVHIVDELALADPLLARLKPIPGRRWRPGHYHRQIPEGYVETLRSGQNVIADPALAAYYEKLRLVTRGRVWDGKRLLEVAKLNLGMYGHLLSGAVGPANEPQPPVGQRGARPVRAVHEGKHPAARPRPAPVASR